MNEINQKDEQISQENSTDSTDIVIVSQTFWPEPIGTPLYVTDLAKWLADRNVNIRVFTGRPYYPEFKLYPGYEGNNKAEEKLGSISIFRIPTYVPISGSILGRAKSEVNFLLRNIARIITGRLQKSKHVISFSPSIMGTFVGIFAKARNGKHVTIVHDIQSGLAVGSGIVGNKVIYNLIVMIEKFVLNRVDSIIVLTDEMKIALQQKGIHTQIDVLPIWVDHKKLYPLPVKRETSNLVLYSGNLGHKQGLDQILSLATELNTVRPDLKVRIRGSGSQYESVRKEIARLGLDNTELRPLLPLEQLNEGLAEGCVHLVPQSPDTSDYSIPSKIFNIMATGRPFVCTASPGSRLWMLQKDTSAFICTPPYDPQAYASAVIKLVDDPQKCIELGAKGREYVETHTSRDVILEQYAKICDIKVDSL
jgi:colanic acid biosynthesis glycosyl transferase WcaI